MIATFGSFDPMQVTALQVSFDHACKELGIPTQDDESRCRIAKAIIALAKTGQVDTERLVASMMPGFKAFAIDEVR
ncbi:MAG: hypothetical protein QM780_17910 [Hyphomicrobium sp.]|uniref:hypothetical protein n=1 Tax=Hyphomicrobium sp. TaxID=82 RepID=UPI0039E2AEDA